MHEIVLFVPFRSVFYTDPTRTVELKSTPYLASAWRFKFRTHGYVSGYFTIRVVLRTFVGMFV